MAKKHAGSKSSGANNGGHETTGQQLVDAQPVSDHPVELEWADILCRLDQFIAWDENPRQSTRQEAEAIIQSFLDFGQVIPFACGPAFELYDGHQRLHALLALQTGKFEFDYPDGDPRMEALYKLSDPTFTYKTVQSNRPLTQEERRKLVVTLHAGATGTWNRGVLSGWDSKKLNEWGFNADKAKGWGDDAALARQVSASGWQFQPADQPVIQGQNVTPGQVKMVDMRLAAKFGEHAAEYIALICPKCGDEYYIRKDELS